MVTKIDLIICHLPLMNLCKNNEYNQEIPQSQTADNTVAPLNRHETPGRQIKQSNQLSLFPIKMIPILERT